MDAFDIGDLVRSSHHFSVNGVSTDPSTVVVKYRLDGDTVVTKTYGSDAEVVKDSTGRFHIDITPTGAGLWHVRWIGTGTAQCQTQKSFRVRETEF